MKSFLKKLLFGIQRHKEYICAAAGAVSGGLECFAVVNGKQVPATDDLLFLGYRPLLLAWITEEFDGKNLALEFRRKDNAAKLATLQLQLEKEIPLNGKKFFVFKGISSGQKFESSFHQFMFRWYERFRPKHTNNVELDPQLYNMVKIAYSIPREIKLITLENEKGRNIFPTDLHGKAGSSYIISLRHDKKSCAQVQEMKCLALWTISSEKAKDAYAMGSNHSKELSTNPVYPFKGESPMYGFPEPEGALSCCELELENVIGDFGIHRLLLFKIVSGSGNDKNAGRLIHLHRSYVQWHIKNGFTFTEAKR